MNGRSRAKYFSFAGAAGVAALLPRGPLERFSAALLASMLLHAVVLFAPPPGARTDVSPTVDRSVRLPPASHALEVRIDRLSQRSQAASPIVAPRSSQQPEPAPERTPGAEWLPVPGPRYYTAEELTKRPVANSSPNIEAFKDARSVNGRVVLKLWIDELGEVQSAQVEESNLPPKISRTAAEAFAKVRFTPGEIDGRRVRCLLRFEVTYGRAKRPG